MKNYLIPAAFILLPSLASSADAAFENCHNISDNEIRLKCYDTQTGYDEHVKNSGITDDESATSARPEETAQGKQWQYSDEHSALDNRKDVWLSVRSDNTEGNSIGTPKRATLWLRCMDNKTNVLIGFDRYTTDDQNVRFKFDDGSVQKQWMATMRGGDGIGIWSGSRAIPFIKKMYGKDRMVIAYETYSGPVEFSFNISGVRARIDVLADACSWKP